MASMKCHKKVPMRKKEASNRVQQCERNAGHVKNKDTKKLPKSCLTAWQEKKVKHTSVRVPEVGHYE